MYPDLARFPARPPSEMEWEDLLVRYEIGPRALQVALADAADPASVAGPLAELAAAEAWAGNALDAMRSGGAVPAASDPSPAGADARSLADEYARMRGRSFAAVQRRGLDVWEWAAEVEGEGRVSAYQLLNAAVAFDGRVLARVRSALRGAAR
jgi:hypothetical protein